MKTRIVSLVVMIAASFAATGLHESARADWRGMDPLPVINARNPKREGDFLLMTSKSGRQYYLPLKLKARLVRNETFRRGAKQFHKLVLDLEAPGRPPAGYAPVNPEAPELSLGHGAWRATDQVQWVVMAIDGGTGYRLEIEGRLGALDDFLARLATGTMAPYFKDQLRMTVLVSQLLEWEADSAKVDAIRKAGFTCTAGSPVDYVRGAYPVMFSEPKDCYFPDMNPIDPRVVRQAIAFKEPVGEAYTMVYHGSRDAEPTRASTIELAALTALSWTLAYPNNYRGPQQLNMPAYFGFAADIAAEGGSP